MSDSSSFKHKLSEQDSSIAVKDGKKKQKTSDNLGFSSFSAKAPLFVEEKGSTVSIFASSESVFDKEQPKTDESILLKKTAAKKIIKTVSGEEDEENILKMNAKLYRLDCEEVSKDVNLSEEKHMKYNGKADIAESTNITKPKFKWKELGKGMLHLNKPKDSSNKPRLVMRRDGVLNVLLNCLLDPGFIFENANDTSLRFTSYNGERNESYLLRLANKEDTTLLSDKLSECIKAQK